MEEARSARHARFLGEIASVRAIIVSDKVLERLAGHGRSPVRAAPGGIRGPMRVRPRFQRAGVVDGLVGTLLACRMGVLQTALSAMRAVSSALSSSRLISAVQSGVLVFVIASAAASAV